MRYLIAITIAAEALAGCSASSDQSWEEWVGENEPQILVGGMELVTTELGNTKSASTMSRGCEVVVNIAEEMKGLPNSPDGNWYRMADAYIEGGEACADGDFDEGADGIERASLYTRKMTTAMEAEIDG